MDSLGLLSLLASVLCLSSQEIEGSAETLLAENSDLPEHYQIAEYILKNYNKGYIPKRLNDGAIKVTFSMELYQIIQINEPQQYLLLNSWMAERWIDNLLGWDPDDFSNVSQIMVPYDHIWIPDTTLYNSLVMDESSTRKLLSVKLTTRGKDKGALVELLYPTIFKQSCMLDLRFFPFDLQKCKLTFGSWTYDNTLIDYLTQRNVVGTSNCIENEAWTVLSTSVERIEKKYECCPNNYTILELYLNVQRKPLYYLMNLVTPTSIITFISIVGFFSSPSMNDLRTEKISLGITTLLSMSILVFMVSDKMPSTSSFIPLIGWFYSSMILLITFGTLAASFVIYIQKKGIIGKRPSMSTMKWARAVNKICRMEQPLLMKQAYAQKAREDKMKKMMNGNRKKSVWNKLVDAAKDPMRKQSTGSDKMNRVRSTPLIPQLTPTKHPKSVRVDVPEFIEPRLTVTRSEDDLDSAVDIPPLKLTKAITLDSIDTSDLLAGVCPSSPNLRDLAQLEWDWLAALVERSFLIVFTLLFICASIGINLLGFFMWLAARNQGFMDLF